MPRPIRIGVTVGNDSPVVPLDYMRPNYQASIFVDILTGSSGTYTVETTADDVQAPGYDPDGVDANWQAHSSLANLSASDKGHLDFPATALRLKTSAGSGTIRLAVIEGGGTGGRR